MKFTEWLEGLFQAGCFGLSCAYTIGAIVAPIVGIIFVIALFKSC